MSWNVPVWYDKQAYTEFTSRYQQLVRDKTQINRYRYEEIENLADIEFKIEDATKTCLLQTKAHKLVLVDHSDVFKTNLVKNNSFMKTDTITITLDPANLNPEYRFPPPSDIFKYLYTMDAQIYESYDARTFMGFMSILDEYQIPHAEKTWVKVLVEKMMELRIDDFVPFFKAIAEEVGGRCLHTVYKRQKRAFVSMMDEYFVEFFNRDSFSAYFDTQVIEKMIPEHDPTAYEWVTEATRRTGDAYRMLVQLSEQPEGESRTTFLRKQIEAFSPARPGSTPVVFDTPPRLAPPRRRLNRSYAMIRSTPTASS